MNMADSSNVARQQDTLSPVVSGNGAVITKLVGRAFVHHSVICTTSGCVVISMQPYVC
jgi:hypothetical protein